MAEPNDIERVVRTRLRSLRNTLGLSLDELAARANLSPSTISRIETGEAAEFATMTPHACAAVDGPAELIMIFDRDGQRAHVHRETSGAGDSR